MEIGKQIKKYRNEIGISQDELAEKNFVSRQTISSWENSKSYPDLRSLLLLGSLFDVSLDNLIKGDLEKMKEKVKEEDIKGFKREGNILTILMIILILSPVPLVKLWNFVGLGIYGVIFIITMYYALRVEKTKKNFDVQTYKEILYFEEGKTMDEIEKNREYGKRPYQKFLLAVGAGVITLVVGVVIAIVIRVL